MAGFLDLTRIVGRVMGSELLLSVCNTFASLFKVLWVTSRYNITPKMLKTSVKVTDSGQIWTLWRVFLDLTRLLGRVMGSELVLSVCNTFASLYKVLWVIRR